MMLIWMGLAAPFVAIALFTAMIAREKRRQARGESVRTGGVLVGLMLVAVSLMPFAAASGQYDENRVSAACAKHGMGAFRVTFGRSRCVDKDGQLRAFEDVR